MQILILDGDDEAYNPYTGELVYERNWFKQSAESVLGYLEFSDEGISDIFVKRNCPDVIKEFITSMEFADWDNSIVDTIKEIKACDVLCIQLDREGSFNGGDEEDEDNYDPEWKGFVFVSIN